MNHCDSASARRGHTPTSRAASATVLAAVCCSLVGTVMLVTHHGVGRAWDAHQPIPTVPDRKRKPRTNPAGALAEGDELALSNGWYPPRRLSERGLMMGAANLPKAACHQSRSRLTQKFTSSPRNPDLRLRQLYGVQEFEHEEVDRRQSPAAVRAGAYLLALLAEARRIRPCPRRCRPGCAEGLSRYRLRSGSA